MLTDTDGAPKKLYRLTLFVDGHTWEEVLYNLFQFADHVKDHGENCGRVGGGGYIDIHINPGMTKERYDAEIETWYSKRCDLRDIRNAGNKAVALIKDLLETGVGCQCNKPDHRCGRNQRLEDVEALAKAFAAPSGVGA